TTPPMTASQIRTAVIFLMSSTSRREILHRRLNELERAGFEAAQTCFELAARRFDLDLVSAGRHRERVADDDRDRREGFRDLRPIPAAERPAAIGLDVKRQHRIAGGFRKPDRARLRDSG